MTRASFHLSRFALQMRSGFPTGMTCYDCLTFSRLDVLVRGDSVLTCPRMMAAWTIQ